MAIYRSIVYSNVICDDLSVPLILVLLSAVIVLIGYILFFLVLLSAVIVLIGYILFFMVMRQNSYASRVIEIQKNQKVIDTGLYALVRHPMYFASILMFLFMPLLLGSFYSLILMLIYPFQINLRIKNEEEILEKGLDGYSEYKKR